MARNFRTNGTLEQVRESPDLDEMEACSMLKSPRTKRATSQPHVRGPFDRFVTDCGLLQVQSSNLMASEAGTHLLLRREQI